MPLTLRPTLAKIKLPDDICGRAIHAKLKDVAEAFAQQQASQENARDDNTVTLRQAAGSR